MLRFLASCMVLAISGMLNAQHLRNFYNRVGGSGIDVGHNIVVLPNNDIACAGTSSSFGSGQSDAYLVVFDSLGNEKWSKTFGGSLAEQIYDFKYNPLDSCFILVGYSSSNANADYNAFAIRYNEKKGIQWQIQFGTSDWDMAYGLYLGQNNVLFVCGYSSNAGLGKDDAMLWKLDYNNGTLLQALKCGGSENDYFYGITELNSNHILLYGQTQSFGNLKGDGYIVKARIQGDTISSRVIHETRAADFKTSCMLANGYILLGGSIDSLNNGLCDAWFVKLDTLSLTPFYKRSHGLKACNEKCTALMSHSTFYSEAYALFNTCENDVSTTDPKLIYLTWGGDFWGGYGTGTFGFDHADDALYAMAQTPSKALVFTGYTRGLNASDQDLLLIRKDSASCIAESIVSLPTIELQKKKLYYSFIYSKSKLNNTLPTLPFNQPPQALYDISGKLFYNEQSSVFSDEILAHAPNGFYILKLKNGQKLKFIICD